MNYPVWFIPGFGGGLLIALVAITHVFVSHFAVGGGLYLVFAERKAIREKNPAIMDFIKGHAKFFLLLTMVYGGLTGVAIWFVISLIHPAATSLLIHTFVFGWAAEWVFFLVEIIALFIYFYTFGRMDDKNHQIIGWIYFISAWMSLFLINGIIDFMLTPGQWLSNGDFWAGFFNPTFWPSLVFRSCIAFMLAGVYAFLTTTFLTNPDTKKQMIRFSGMWALVSLVASLPAGWWYVSVLPQQAQTLVTGSSPTIARATLVGGYSLALLAALCIIMMLLSPKTQKPVLAFVVLFAAMGYMGSFEWTREAARRPYIINEVMYSNGILKTDVERLNTEGFLKNAKWVKNKEVTDANLLDAGKELFMMQCYACHTLDGINNDIRQRTASMSFGAMRKYLSTIHEKRYFMPPFTGTDLELKALAAYLVKGLHNKPLDEPVPTAGGKGKTLFEENCAACHGADIIKGKLTGWDATKVRGALDQLSKLNPAMPDCTLPPADRDELAAYLFSLNNPGAAAPAGDPGQKVFDDNCSMCHAIDGGALPLASRIKGWDKTRLRKALDELDKIKGGVMPPLNAPPADKDALAAYLIKSTGGAQ